MSTPAAAEVPLLLPTPRTMSRRPGTHRLRPGRVVLLDAPRPGELLPAAWRLQPALAAAGAPATLSAAGGMPAGDIAVHLHLDPDLPAHPQGYRLEIDADQVRVDAADPQGAFYGACTLVQLLQQATGGELPGLRVNDVPDFPARGVMLDVSRDKVPTLATLEGLVDLLAGWKVNQLQLYTEHTFAYHRHSGVFADATPYTGEDMLELDAYCRSRFVELVPNQNSFGHLTRWLTREPYRALAEAPDGFDRGSGWHADPYSLCPGDPGSLDLLCGWYDELLPHFSSDQFNVGCDETFDLGQGRSAAACAEHGVGRVYLDFLTKIHAEVAARGRTMQFWGDIIEQHPELIGELPAGVVPLAWGYEADHPFDEAAARYAATGLRFYVCPGTSSWNSVAGRTDNALANLRSAAAAGSSRGATGFLNTDWGDNGHWQPLAVSLLGFAAGAAYSWGVKANGELDVATATGRFAFGDPSGRLGRLAYDLGNVYRAAGFEPHNASALFLLLQSADLAAHRPAVLERLRAGVTVARLAAAEDAIDAAMAYAGSPTPAPAGDGGSAADTALARTEFGYAARLLRHACARGRLLLGADLPAGEPDRLRGWLTRDLDGVRADHEAVWLARNRRGGLADSAARLDRLRADYTG